MNISPSLYLWHNQKSSHNFDVYKYLNQKNPHYVDWEINAIFYSACKLMDAYLIKNFGFKPNNHKSRNIEVRKISQIKDDYLNLYHLSQQSRYDEDVVEEDKQDAITWYNSISRFLNQYI